MYLCIFPHLSHKCDQLFCEYVSCVSYVSCTICIICNKCICVFPHLSQKCDQLFRKRLTCRARDVCFRIHLVMQPSVLLSWVAGICICIDMSYLSPNSHTTVLSARLLFAVLFLVELVLHMKSAEWESWRVSPMYRTAYVGGVCFVSTVRLLP